LCERKRGYFQFQTYFQGVCPNSAPVRPSSLTGSIESLIKLKSENVITVYFDSINGYVGLDRSLFRYSIFHLIFWYYIHASEQTTESEKLFCDYEIRNFFYQVLGSLYSIKEKIMGFVGCELKKGKLTFAKSALSKIGIEGFTKILYSNTSLIEMINMRNLIIHDCYNLDFIPQKFELKLSHFNFDLTTKNTKSSNYIFNINENTIITLYENIVNLIGSFKDFIRDTNNIDIEKIKSKFLSSDGKRYVLTFP
jgi:hypothetical protein